MPVVLGSAQNPLLRSHFDLSATYNGAELMNMVMMEWYLAWTRGELSKVECCSTWTTALPLAKSLGARGNYVIKCLP
jgi:hypothetical protein